MTDARMQPLVVTPTMTTVSTPRPLNSMSSPVSKNELAYFFRTTRSEGRGRMRSSTSTHSLPLTRISSAGTFTMNCPASRRCGS